MDFKEAFAFDEEDRLKAAMVDQSDCNGSEPKLMKRIRYLILG